MKKLRAQLREIIKVEMAQDPAHDILHLDRVWAQARRIAKDEGIKDRRVLLAAAYLHDLVNLPKDSPNRKQASTLSAEKAEPILAKLGYSDDEIKAAQHAIKAHSYSADIPPETREAEILRDADRLDALGAVGIARTFMVAGTMDRPLADPIDPFAANRRLDDQLWSIDHWHLKLLQLPNEMNTRKGRKIARKRAKLMLAYLVQLSKEMDTNLPDHWADLLK
ncbi:HD domain-containing protein [Cognatishimia sp. 1_MG-2023]|uniref:HD domain-containing protein n=1 Tax=Cognatishimia sp. 1_MG-2023 TaxID=3062642 RepID=UPI0026E3D7D4|nr:HD domain-containing protein [Cognatishimia sp. 1_MG-2023]MDO6727169.1 HD domain-containing protein [Cognatishimia sp. 1_MG-2023]